jgi:hypothetical protein
MTFRNTALIIFIFLLLNSCKGLQYYKSGTNPAGISVLMESPSAFFTNEDSKDSIKLYLVNGNSNDITISNWINDIQLIGRSRFYTKEITLPVAAYIDARIVSNFKSGDTVFLGGISIKKIMGQEKNWTFKTEKVLGPHLVTLKKFYPYMYIMTELNIKVPNQAEIIKIRSEDKKIIITKSYTPSLQNKKTILSLTSDKKQFDLQKKEGNLVINITNTGTYPIPLFNDPGSVRFKIYAYNANRTAIMFTQFVLDNGKLPVSPVNIEVNGNYHLTIPLEQLLFSETPSKPVYYWSWNKKSPPVSPLVYGKKDLAMNVEFWFGVVVDGKEYLSNTLTMDIGAAPKKTSK